MTGVQNSNGKSPSGSVADLLFLDALGHGRRDSDPLEALRLATPQPRESGLLQPASAEEITTIPGPPARLQLQTPSLDRAFRMDPGITEDNGGSAPKHAPSSLSLPTGAPVLLSSHDLLSAAINSAPDAGSPAGPSCRCQGCSRLAVDGEAAAPSVEQAPIVLNGLVTLAGGLDLGKTFLLSSNPYAKKSIFLDFDGFQISSTPWENGGALSLKSFYTSIDATALTEIQRIWQRVAEDFAPFDVNVTTQDPGTENLRKFGTTDDRWGIRVAFTSNVNLLTGAAIANAGGGGTAYYNSFNWSTDDVALVFNRGEYSAAATASHEVGHTLNLTHDGNATTEYYAGHGGTGATSWGTIMGAPYLGNDENLTQWSKGEYVGANNTQDDLATLTSDNGFSYASDDHGNTFSTATLLGGTSFSSFGVIERNTDVDLFRFDTGAGLVSFNIVNASRAFVASGGSYLTEYLASRGPNLDIAATLYRADQSVYSTFNPADLTTAGFSINLDAGTYYLGIDGVGSGNPWASTPTGSSDYGSLGQYMVSGTVQPATVVPPITVTPPPPPPPPAPTLVMAASGPLVTTEAGGTTSFQVSLSRAPTQDVIVNLVSSNTAEGTLLTNRLVFTSSNWSTPQTVMVKGVDDAVVDGSKGYAINLTTSSSDTTFDQLVTAPMAVSNLDNDVLASAATFTATSAGLRLGRTYITAPTVTGTLANISTSDNQYLALTEGSFYVKTNVIGSTLNAYQLSFNNLVNARQLIFEGFRTQNLQNDNFQVQVSTNGGTNWTTAFLVDSATEKTLTYNLAAPLNGSALVRILDTNLSSTARFLDTLSIDRLVFSDRALAPAPMDAAPLEDPIIGSAVGTTTDPGDSLTNGFALDLPDTGNLPSSDLTGPWDSNPLPGTFLAGGGGSAPTPAAASLLAPLTGSTTSEPWLVTSPPLV